MTRSIEEIISDLKEIEALELKIQERVYEKSRPVFDKEGVELNKINIKLKIKLMAEQLMADQRAAFDLNKSSPPLNPVLVVLMDGGMPFGKKLSEELQRIGYSHSYTAVSVSSYGDDIKSSGHVQIQSEPKLLLGARNVIVVDDVCDTGKTYLKIRGKMLMLGALSVNLMVLVDKEQQRSSPHAFPLYACSKVGADEFLIGCGLDFMQGETHNMLSVRSVNLDSLPTSEEKSILDRKKDLNHELRLAIMPKEKLTAEQIGKRPNSIFSPVIGRSERNLTDDVGSSSTPSNP